MAKTNPIISWIDAGSLLEYGATGAPAKMTFSSDATSYQPILAGTDSVPLKFAIANNFTKDKASTVDCYDIKNVSLTVKSANGDFESPIVKEQWISVTCAGSKVTKQKIGATLEGDKYVETKVPVSADTTLEATIKGGTNDGKVAGTAKFNVAYVDAVMHPPVETQATANKNTGKFRLIYTFGEGI